MKKLFICLTLLLASLGIVKAQESPVGAWTATSGDITSVLLITPSWFTVTDYRAADFVSTYGGTWQQAGNGETTVAISFNTANPNQVGQNARVPVTMENGQLVTNAIGGGSQRWTRLDDGGGPLAGKWKITARENNGKMNTIPDGPRQTFKILTGTRFQWVAVNLSTGEFFGTGGGTYTFDNGTYTEKIAFFSRDNTRVGAALSFKGKVNGNEWDHSGLSSKGDPIHEVWIKTLE
ncbi:hypothetical protein FHW36_106168 [Chitinophaga polysaccharea]|uniref:Membrane or secreted protein n=1 Tax=Chitinophaga polysaccharea TaxID=1293035 RepID=A0A561PLG2_9BACT|nr:hypothetical protein [Chitinophaga polysaccharea]TWF38945.1 hypothetical protein FHW36_106168 [Chitinophaga polysaccharea]